MNRREIIFLGGLSVLAPNWATAGELDSAVVSGISPRRVMFSLTVINPLSEDLLDQRLWAYAPARSTATQRLVNLELSRPHTVQTDELGHSVLALQWDKVPAYATTVVTVTAWLEMAAQPRLEDLKKPAYWLIAERFIETGDAAVKAVAEQLRRDTPHETARAIYEWVSNRLSYAGYVSDDLGAAYAAREHRGDCTEYAYLVVALSRVLGIPARMLGGYVTPRDAVLVASGYHNWAEVYLDGAWRVVDAQKRNWLTREDQYVAFRIYRDAVINPVGHAHRFQVQGQITASLGAT